MAGLMTALVVIGSGILAQSLVDAPDEYLLGGMQWPADSLIQAEAVFGSAGLKDYEVVEDRVRVPASKRDLYLKVLAEADALPTKNANFMAKALADTSPFESGSHRQARAMNAKEQDLSKRIESFPEVSEAFVVYDQQREGMFGERRQSATVWVKPNGTEPLSSHRRKAIREMMVGAFAGLKPEHVVVTDANDRGGVDQDALELDDPYYKTKRLYERQYERKLRELLVGFEPFQLTVGVTLDPTINKEASELRYEAEPTTLMEANQRSTREHVRPVRGGVPGVASNAYGNKPAAITETPEQVKSEETAETVNRVTGHSHVVTRTAGLHPHRVAVSLLLPWSYYEKVYRREFAADHPDRDQPPPPMATADRERIKNEAVSALQKTIAGVLPPLPAGDDRYPQVSIEDYADLPELLAPEAPASPASVANVTQWLAESWQVILLASIAIGALWLIRGLTRPLPTAPSPAAFEDAFGLEIPVARAAPEAKPESPVVALKALQSGQDSLRDELAGLVDQNPDAAANILRSWIGDAA